MIFPWTKVIKKRTTVNSCKSKKNVSVGELGLDLGVDDLTNRLTQDVDRDRRFICRQR